MNCGMICTLYEDMHHLSETFFDMVNI